MNLLGLVFKTRASVILLDLDVLMGFENGDVCGGLPGRGGRKG